MVFMDKCFFLLVSKLFQSKCFHNELRHDFGGFVYLFFPYYSPPNFLDQFGVQTLLLVTL